MDHFITLTCPSCGGKVQIDDRQRRFTCQYCGNEHILQTTAVPAPAAHAALRPRIPTPDSVHIEKNGRNLTMVQRWFSLKYIPLAFFCIVWAGFLIFWYSMAFGQGMQWVFLVIPLVHLAVGVGLTYYTLAGFFNRTVLEITPAEITVRFEPLPWMGEKRLKTADLKQFFCKERASRRRNGMVYTYQLYGVTHDDHQVLLLGNLDSPDFALFFEQQIEGWLRIENQPVAGEITN